VPDGVKGRHFRAHDAASSRISGRVVAKLLVCPEIWQVQSGVPKHVKVLKLWVHAERREEYLSIDVGGDNDWRNKSAERGLRCLSWVWLCQKEMQERSKYIRCHSRVRIAQCHFPAVYEPFPPSPGAAPLRQTLPAIRPPPGPCR
jgi:hypothetical protein